MKVKEKYITWFKRMGWAAFFFFLLKGIAWLVVFYLLGDAILK